ncbi:phage scaffolding protein [Fusobacterium pseudoperiodonticum]|uniref:phage scaffolding protein n=1 Tax=Fusobacterium pseudoperiodonticum TaxID=2663009 RepID=UPI0028D451AD|nr:phage scaffolding protein [Fusobacterium pseudoperiodonticum]
MELKDGKIIISDEEKKILGSNEGKQWLTDNKFMIETVKEIEKPLTAEAVTEFISKNQSLSDKLYNDNATKFLKTKLGDKVTSDDLGKEIVLKSEFDNFKNETIRTAVNFGLSAISPKYANMLVNAVDYSKLDVKDGEIVGFKEQIEAFKNTYPDLFNEKGSSTPPPLPPNDGHSKVTYDDFLKMSEAEKAKLTDDELKQILRD